MPDGEMRRPPQLWEQKLSRITSILGVGISSSGDATSIVNPSPPPGSDGPGTDPGPTLPPPGDFIKPSTPTLVGAVQGIRVQWDGLNSAGDLWPYDTSWIEVHMDTSGTAFTLGSATLKGRLDYPGEFYVGGLTAGTTYHFRLRGADPQGNFTDPSDTASGQTGLTTSSDYGTATITAGAVSFDARQIGGVTSTVGTTQPTSPVVGDIWLDTTGGATTHKRWNGSTWETILFGSGSIANNAITETKIANDAITTPKIAANAVTANEIAANTITGGLIAANTITSTNIATGAITAGAIAAGAVTAGKIAADAIDAMTITGATVRTSASGARVVFNTSGIVGYDSLNNERFSLNASTGDATVTGSFRTGTSGARIETGSVLGVVNGINFYSATALAGQINNSSDSGLIINAPNNKLQLLGLGIDLLSSVEITGNVDISSNVDIGGQLDVAGRTRLGASGANPAFRVQDDDVYSYGIEDNTTANDANVRVGASAQLLKSTSTVRLKDELVPLDNELAGVPEDKIANFPASVDPYDVLSLTPTEFRSLSTADSHARMLGFIAEDVAAKLPWAANWDDDGLPSAVEDRPILAALLWVVREQQATITDLRTRIEALEA